MSKHMEGLCDVFIQCPGDTLIPSDRFDLEPSLDSTVFQKAVIVSMAYMASMPELPIDVEAQKKLTRSENEFAIEQAKKSEKLYAFISVNPLTDYAIEEAEYWINSGRTNGLKLHLANSDFDFFNPDHIQKLQSLLKAVDNPSIGILAHLRTRNPNYGVKDIEVFLTQILPYAPESTWVIAHVGGWGGYDDATDAVLAKIINAFNSGQINKDRIYLDLAAVVLSKENPLIPKNVLKQQEEKFIKRFRSLKTNNWVFGSDWSPKDDRFQPYRYLKTLLNAGLEEKELKTIIRNRLPFIR